MGAEVQEEVANELAKIIDRSGFRRSNYDTSYSFYRRAGTLQCTLTAAIEIHNGLDKPNEYEFRHEFHRGFLHDYGTSLSFEHFKIYYPDTSEAVLETDRRSRTETPHSVFYGHRIPIPARRSVRVVSVVTFGIGDHFSFYESFSQPIHGVRIRLDHTLENAEFGFSYGRFWKERFVREGTEPTTLSLHYSGVVFPGQGIGFWMHANKPALAPSVRPDNP